MLTFERILQVFEDILREDPLYEIVSTSHGYTLLGWDSHGEEWYSAEILRTANEMLEALLRVYSNYWEYQFTKGERELTAYEEKEIDIQCEKLRKNVCYKNARLINQSS